MAVPYHINFFLYNLTLSFSEHNKAFYLIIVIVHQRVFYECFKNQFLRPWSFL